jgi:hydroxymethylpyrimidine/phosphomethylpyrimidine kinase
MHPTSDIQGNRPIVLCFSGLDPSGGAGIQADIEALYSIGCHCAPVITCTTVQDTRNVIDMTPGDPSQIIAQARAVLEDLPIAAIKTGLTGSIPVIEVIHTLLRDYPHIPVVADPVLNAAGGYDFGADTLVDAYRSLLLPQSLITTPNSPELEQLARHSDSLDAAASELLDLGCEHVLLTGTHLPEERVSNRLYTEHQPVITYEWPRLPHEYHGSGCTLAAALAGFLAHGCSIPEASRQAQEYTWHALEVAWRPGCGQWIPERGFWHHRNNGRA